MFKIDETVKKETLYIGKITFLLCIILQSVFLIIRKWDYTVALGSVLGLIAATGNFFLLGITVQKALNKSKEDAKTAIKVSQLLRYLMIIIIAAIAYLLPCFNIIATVVPLLFPRIAIALKPIFTKE